MDNTTIASEGGHWYDQDGSPCYEVQNASKPGEMRPTTLRDAKKMGLVPSVTTITRILAAPGLDKWKQQQILMAAATSPYDRDTMSADEWAQKVMADAQEQSQKAMQLGTDIHGAIEKYLIEQSIDKDFLPFVIPLIHEMESRGMLTNRKVEHSFAHPIGFGGKIDYHNDSVLVDFKTKDFSDTKKNLAWDEQCYQLAAYRFGIQSPQLKCYNIFISTSVPGLIHVHEWEEEELKRGLKIFLLALDLWKSIKL